MTQVKVLAGLTVMAVLGVPVSAMCGDTTAYEAVSPATQAECDIAVAVAQNSLASVKDANVDPVLAGDDKNPGLDCTATFKSAGFADYVLVGTPGAPARPVWSFDRPVVVDGKAEIDMTSFVPPSFYAVDLYTLTLSDGHWTVTGKRQRMIT